MVLAAGVHIVEWIIGENGSTSVWKAALALVLAALGGSVAVVGLNRR